MRNYYLPFSQASIMAALKPLLLTADTGLQITKDGKLINSLGMRQSLKNVGNTVISLREQMAVERKGLHYAYLADQGACQSFTIAWLSLLFSDAGSPELTANTRLETLKNSHRKIMQLHQEYYLAVLDTKNVHADSALLQSQGLRETGASERSLLGGSLAEKVWVELNDEMCNPHSPGLIHSFCFVDAEGRFGGHTIGYFRQLNEEAGKKIAANDEVVVFDPNLGETLIKADDLPSVFFNILSHYGVNLTDSSLRYIDIDPMTRAKHVSFAAIRPRPTKVS